MSIKYISHRGESFDAPENSLAAFKLSLERNTDGMECDVRLSADGVAVVSHDASTARMGDQNLPIDKSDFAQLAKVNISGNMLKYNEFLPCFAATLDFLGDRLYYVELENDLDEMIFDIKRSIEEKKVPYKNIIFISFFKSALIKCKKIMPQAKRLWLTTLLDDNNNPLSSTQLIKILQEIKVDGVNAQSNEDIINEQYIKAVKKHGFEFCVWTIDQPEQAKRFKDFGVDAITSNCAALLKQIC